MSQFLYDKAFMALKAKRYDEAQSTYEKALEQEYTVGNANVMDAFMLNIKIVTDKSNKPISFQRSNLVFPEPDASFIFSIWHRANYITWLTFYE